MAGHNVYLVALHLPGQARLGLSGYHPAAQLLSHLLHIARAQAQFLSDSHRLERFNPMKYKHRIQTRKG